MKKNIFVKFIVLVSFVGLFVGATGVYLFSIQQKKLAEGLYFNFANSIAKSVDASITENEIDNPEILRQSLFKLLLLNSEIMAINVNLEKNGQLIVLTSTADNFSDQEIIQDSIYARRTFDEKISLFHEEEYQGQDALGVTVPLHISGNVVGTYEIIMSLSDLEESANLQIKNLIFLTIVLLFLLSLSVLILTKIEVSNPLNKIIDATKSIEAGNFDVNIKIKNKDEIGSLASAYIKMAQNLKIMYHNLEQKVAERTGELNSKLDLIQGQNKLLQENKSAMLNLLEDSRELENKLEIEKESVEAKVIDRTKELIDEKAKLISSIENLDSAYILLDLTGKIVLYNSNLISMFGNFDGFPTMAKLQDKLGESCDLAESYKDSLVTKKNIYHKVIELGPKFLKISVIPVLKNKNEIINVLIIVHDVTEEKVLSRSKDEFFSIASHELRTPLTAIRGNASLIKQFFSEKLKDPELIEMVNDIEESTVRLINIVNDFLNVGRLEQGKMVFKNSEFDLYTLAEESVKQYQVTGSRQKLYLKVEKPDNVLPLVYADQDKVRQTLINLVGNSLKFTESGGVTINFKGDANYVYVYITDTGRGILPANQALLFKKFQQAESSLYTRDTTKGTGLGLYISRLMVEGMKGKIWLEKSEPNVGTTFAFSIPIKK